MSNTENQFNEPDSSNELQQKYMHMCQSQQHWQNSFLRLNDLLENPSSTAIAAAQEWLDSPKEDLTQISVAEQVFKIVLDHIRMENDMDPKSGLNLQNENVTNA